MNVTGEGTKRSQSEESYRSLPQKDSAEHESYAGARSPSVADNKSNILDRKQQEASRAGRAEESPGLVAHASRITENNITDARTYEARLLERILERNNMNRAYKRVKSNKGAAGVDGMEVDAMLKYLKENGEAIMQAIMEGKYKPNPVRRVEIPKDDGKKRPLGIPTVVDRVIQQAISQVLSPIFERQF